MTVVSKARRLCGALIAGTMVAALGVAANAGAAYADMADGAIVADAWVSGGDDGKAHVDETLSVGKDVESYIRIDLGSIADDAESVTLHLSKKNAANTLTVRRAPEAGAWAEGDLTWKTRPEAADEGSVSVDVANGDGAFDVDITALVKAAEADKAADLTLGLSTGGGKTTDLYSTRADLTLRPYVDVVAEGADQPSDLEVGTPFASYVDNGSSAQMVAAVRADDGRYLAVNKDTGTVGLTDSRDSASLFAIYGYDYTASDYDGKGGAQQTTYAIKALDNDKYLTVQNYDPAQGRPYYNMADETTYEVKATAPDVQWHERFYLHRYAKSGTIAISSPLSSLRDGSEAAQWPVKAGESGMTSIAGDRHVYKYTFEQVPSNLLEAHASVSGTTATVRWAPVNGDADPTHYKVAGGSAVSAGDGVLGATVEGLKAGSNTIAVSYANGDTKAEDTVTARVFTHPGIALTEDQLDAVRTHVANREEPWYSDYLRLKNTAPDGTASADFEDTPQEGVGRGNPSGHGNIGYFERAGAAAYFNALEWVATGDAAHADKAVAILNGWTDKLRILDGRDQILGASLATAKFINAAEIMRYHDGGYAGYKAEDFAKFQSMLLNVVYPVVQDAGAPMNANGNWDTIPINTMLAIGVATDNAAIYDRAIAMYKSPFINGSIVNYVTEWGQTAESARDQQHGQLGVGAMGDTAVIAEHQGDDLWSLEDNRLAKAYNWSAQYNLFSGEGTLRAETVDNIFGRTDEWARWGTMEEQGVYRGKLRPIYETALAHYSKVPGVDVTWMARAAEASRPEGFVNYDNLNFDTLTSYDGPAQDSADPHLQLRTGLAPWYQTKWNDIKKYGDVPEESNSLAGGVLPGDYVTETLNSYYATQSDGSVRVTARQKDAPTYRLVTNDDETYSLQDTASGRYLSVGARAADGTNPITATAATVGDDEKFDMVSGSGSYRLSHDGRMVEQTVTGDDASCATKTPDPAKCSPVLRLGVIAADGKATSANWLQFVYRTAPDDSDQNGGQPGDGNKPDNGGQPGDGDQSQDGNGNGNDASGDNGNNGDDIQDGAAPNAGAPSGDGDAQSAPETGSLATTGANVFAVALTGLVALAIGAAALLRRRRV